MNQHKTDRILKTTWVRKFKFHSMKLAHLICHINFLAACLHFGLIPKGLNLKFPFTGLPPQARPSLQEFARVTNFKLVELVLSAYKDLANNHSTSIKNLHELIMTQFPDQAQILSNITTEAIQVMSTKAQNQLKKLSGLCVKALRSGYHLPTGLNLMLNDDSQLTKGHNSVPCLADQLNLPTPPPLSDDICPASQSSPQEMPGNLPMQEESTSKDQPNNEPKTTDNEPIMNLSNYCLKEAEISVLQKGLTFCPTPKLDHFDLVKDTLEFGRKIRLQHYFSQPENSVTNANDIAPCLTRFQPKSDWQPPPLAPDHPIEQFINVLLSNIANPSFTDSLKCKQNLTYSERNAISSLQKNKDIIILPADKGDTTVILNISDYIEEAQKQLTNTDAYELLNKNPTQDFNDEIKEYIEFKGPEEDLSIKTIKSLTPEEPRTPVFYLLPKVHKPARPPPGRPIVSSYGSPTERISAFVDEQLQPLVTKLPSYIKDTNDFLEKISKVQQPIPQNSLLVSIDVASLYTSISHDNGIKAAKSFLDTRDKNSKPSSNFILVLINFILNMNVFRFQDNIYIQKKGTAMGTRMAPSYANLFMGKLESTFLESQNYKPLIWLRFIDDIFMIWTHGIELLYKFLDALNNFSELKFEWKISSNLITFLDVDVYVDDGFLKSNIHIKETNCMQYLHYNSCHPTYVKRSVPKSLSVRAKRLCSENKNYVTYLEKLTTAFVDRGYPEKLVKAQIFQPQNKKTTNHEQDPKFLTKYFPGLQKINPILKVAFNILKNHPSTNNLFKSTPRVVFRRPPNLQNILVRPKLPSNDNQNQNKQNHHSEPCKKPRCATCKIYSSSNTYKSSNTGRTYPIKGPLNCGSTNIVYQMTCNHCPMDYIGSTTNTLRTRMTGHRFDVVHKKPDKPVAHHASLHSESFENCYNVKALRSCPNTKELRTQELAHQLLLNTRAPFGLNLR